MSKRVLIIEDYISDFETIRDEMVMSKEFELTNIFPRSNFADYTLDISYNEIKLVDYKNEFDFMSDLFKSMNNDNIEEIFNIIFSKFIDIDKYIIDVNLTSQDNKEGIYFYKYLLKKGISSNDIYIVTPKKIKNLDINIDDSHFILKDSAGEFGKTLSNI